MPVPSALLHLIPPIVYALLMVALVRRHSIAVPTRRLAWRQLPFA